MSRCSYIILPTAKTRRFSPSSLLFIRIVTSFFLFLRIITLHFFLKVSGFYIQLSSTTLVPTLSFLSRHLPSTDTVLTNTNPNVCERILQYLTLRCIIQPFLDFSVVHTLKKKCVVYHEDLLLDAPTVLLLSIQPFDRDLVIGWEKDKWTSICYSIIMTQLFYSLLEDWWGNCTVHARMNYIITITLV